MGSGGPLGHQNMAMHDHTVQRAAGRQQVLFSLGAGHSSHQSVHGRVFDTAEVARVFGVSRLAAEHVGVFLAGIVGATVGDGGDVELELLKALLVKRKVHRAELELDTNFLQIARPRRHYASAGFIAIQVLQFKSIALGVAQRTVAVLPTRILQQLLCLAQIVAQGTVAIGAGWHDHGTKHCDRDLRAPRCQQGQLFG